MPPVFRINRANATGRNWSLNCKDLRYLKS